MDGIHKSYIPETCKYPQNRKYMSYGRNNLFICLGKMPSPNVGGSTIGCFQLLHMDYYPRFPEPLQRFKATSYYSVHPPILSAIPWFSKLVLLSSSHHRTTAIPALTSLKGPVLPRVACIFRSKSLAAEVKAWKQNPLKLGEKTVGLDCSKPKYFRSLEKKHDFGRLKPRFQHYFCIILRDSELGLA